MATPILRTKLYFPATRPTLVNRPRLVERLDHGMRGPLTLISAPAGSGKTTLLSEWRAEKDGHLPIAWLSLDANDNDPVRFLTYLVAALESLQPGLLTEAESLLETGEMPTLEVITTSLIVDLQDFPRDFALVLDDYHIINTPSIHQVLSMLIDNLPPQMHLVLLTRADPPLPLARLRASGSLTEIRLAQLRFTQEEATAFLNEVMGLELTPEQVSALETRAEGWIAGLQLAALSMQGQDSANRAEFIQAFAGSHHYILDYLSEEAVNRQPPQVQRFLVRTSVLERMCGSLCDVLTGEDNGAETLAMLDRGNLFLIPLDDERRWYRYHHLFAEMLTNRLRTTMPDEVTKLNLVASTWYDQAGLSDEAIRHSLNARDFGNAGRLLRKNHLEVMYTRQLNTLESWLSAFPEPVIQADPWLGVVRLHVMWATGQRVGLRERALEAQAAMQALIARGEMKEGDPDYAWLWGETLSFLSLTHFGENQNEAIDLAKQAITMLPSDVFPHGFALGALYIAYRDAGMIDESAETCRRAIQVTRALRYPSMLATATASLGYMLNVKGHLREAVRAHEETLQFAADHGLAGIFYFGIVHIGLAEFLREWNRLDEAEYHLNTGMALVKQGGLSILFINGMLNLAWLKHTQGDPKAALAVLEKMRHECRNMGPNTYQDGYRDIRLRCLADLGEMDEVAAWLEEVDFSLESPLTFERARVLLLAVRYLVQLERIDDAMRILNELEKFTRTAGHTAMLISVLVIQGMVFKPNRDGTRALESLEQALALGEPEGYIRTFVNEGEVMRGLLNQLQQKGKASNYVNRLLGVFAEQDAAVTPATRQPSLLSGRELELLGLIAAGRTNREIANELYIAIGTVKRHTVNIFTKLNAANRTEAVALARQMGLIE